MEKMEYRKVWLFFWKQEFRTYLRAFGMLLVVVCPITLFPFFNVAEGPIEVLFGKIVDVYMSSADMYSLPHQVAQVELQNGKVVSSSISSNLAVVKGDVVEIEVYRHRLTGSKNFEIVKVNH